MLMRCRLGALAITLATLVRADPSKGPALSELEVINDVAHLQDVISSDRVSIILFTEGEDDTEESKWFMAFSTFWRSPSTLLFGMCDASALRKAGRVGATGVWLFSRHDSDAALNMPTPLASEDDAQTAQKWVESELIDARCVEVDGAWRKLPSSYVRSTAASAPGSKEEL